MSRVRDALATVTAPARWTWAQVSGLARSMYDYVAGFAIDDVLPPGLRDLINWVIGIFPRAFGIRGTSRRQQINANLALIAASILSGFLTAGASLFLIVFLWGPLLLFAVVVRGTPAGESWWGWMRRKLPIKRDYNLPLWRSE